MAEAEENSFECPFDFEFALLWKRLNSFRREIRYVKSNSVIINRLRRPKVNTLKENFSSNHDLKRKLSIFRTTLYFLLREIRFYPGNARKYLAMWDKLILSEIPAVSK